MRCHGYDIGGSVSTSINTAIYYSTTTPISNPLLVRKSNPSIFATESISRLHVFLHVEAQDDAMPEIRCGHRKSHPASSPDSPAMPTVGLKPTCLHSSGDAKRGFDVSDRRSVHRGQCKHRMEDGSVLDCRTPIMTFDLQPRRCTI